MSRERKLTVVLAGDSKGLTGALTTAERKVDGFGSKIGGLGAKAKVALAGAGVAVIGFAKGSVDAFVEAEEAQSRLSDAFAKFPQLAGGNIEALRSLNEELARKTKFDDDATASGQAVLAQFGLTADQIAKATPLLQDYAAKTGKDLPAAAQDFGKAVLGQGRAFKAIGLNLKDTGSAAGNFEQTMSGLSDQVGGFAQNQGKTAAGQAAILKNQFGELQETVGSKLVPALLTLARFLTSKVLPAVEAVGGWLGKHKPVLIAIAGVIGVGLTAAFISWATAAWSAAAATIAATWPIIAIGAAIAALVAGVIWAYQNWGWFRDAVDAVASFLTGTLWPALKSVGTWISGTLVPIIANIIGTFVQWGAKVGQVAGQIVGYVQGVISWVRTNWPLILGILTGPIGLAVLAVAKHWDTLKAGVTAVKDFFVSKFSALVGFLWSIPGKVREIAGKIWEALKNGLSAAVRWIREKLDSLLGPLDEIAGKVGGVIGKVGGGARKILGGLGGLLADGGPARAGVPYIVGERGPELFIPTTSGTVVPNGAMSTGSPVGGNNFSITVMVPASADKGAVGREIVEAISAYERRNGTGWRAS